MDHNDFGGLHEDLKRTGAAVKRRDVLKLAMGGMGMGALYLFGRADEIRGIERTGRMSLARDSVFRNGVARQMARMTGDASSGFTARLTVAV